MRKRVSIDLNEKNKMDLIKSSKMTLQINKHYGLCLGGHADGIGPWMNQLVTGVDFSGKAQITDLLKIARNNDLLIHPYTFRADRLPSYTSSFDELLDFFFQEAGVDGIFTDHPDQAVRYLEQNSSN